MIGRRAETTLLNRLYESDRAQLVAVYGRRRVGKTFLVDETFRGRITFRHAGLSPVEAHRGVRVSPLKMQLQSFYNSLVVQGMERSSCPQNWLDAFLMLELFLQERDDGGRQLVFLDELPWLDTPRSGFITAFESFWNGWGCHRPNLMVIVCGSATSWILDELINSHGGLYNRVTCEIKLTPFTLAECEEYFTQAGVRLSRYDIVQSYMIFGGIPYYLGYFQPEESLAQNVDRVLFSRNAPLREEYDRLFASIFSQPEMMKSIVGLLATRTTGFTRVEIAEQCGYSGGGTLSNALSALLASDFVVSYVPFGEGKRSRRYRLVDPFCKFWLRFLGGEHGTDPHYWQNNLNAQPVVSWRGIAFEDVCLTHVEQIKTALGVAGVASENSAWMMRGGASGTQIDLIISRADSVANMCEMKFYGGDFAVDKGYYKALLCRQEALAKMVSPKMVVRSTLVTTYGLARNEYSGAFTNVVTMDDLFA